MGEDNLDEFGAAVAGEEPLRALLDEASSQIVQGGPRGLVEAMRSLLPDVDVAVLNTDMGDFVYEWMARGQRDGIDGWVDDDLAFAKPWGFDPASITVPLLILQGRHDKMVPIGHGEWLTRRVPQATAELTDGDGHLTLLARVGDVHAWLLSHG